MLAARGVELGRELLDNLLIVRLEGLQDFSNEMGRIVTTFRKPMRFGLDHSS